MKRKRIEKLKLMGARLPADLIWLIKAEAAKRQISVQLFLREAVEHELGRVKR